MKFFLDTANLNEIRDAAAFGFADGVDDVGVAFGPRASVATCPLHARNLRLRTHLMKFAKWSSPECPRGPGARSRPIQLS